MALTYDVKTTLINEGFQSIDRLMIKVTQLCGKPGEEFIKTFPLLNEYKTRKILPLIENELPPIKKRSFLGIGFNIYEQINYIKFYSTYKSFPLNVGDEIELIFENGDRFTFEFETRAKVAGYMTTNTYPVSDVMLRYLSENNLKQWQLKNVITNHVLVGGFSAEENNHQYFNEKSGQELFKIMTGELLKSKTNWLARRS